MPSPESTAGHVKQARAARSVMRIHIQKKARKQRSFSGRESTQYLHRPALPSSIQTILSAPELHRVMLSYAAPASQRRSCHCPKRLVGFTTDREFTCNITAQGSPCPEGYYFVVKIIPLAGYSALTMQSTGQTETHLGESKWPSHSTQVA